MDTLIRQQMSLSGYIARMWTNLQKLGQARITELEIKTRLERLDDYWRQFQSTHFQLLQYDELSQHEYSTRDIFTISEENYFLVRNKFLTALLPMQSRERANDASPTAASPLIRQMQLPKLNLPKFSGEQLGWESFRDLFRSLVHEVSDIPPVQKLQYLRGCLAGEAEEIAANLPLTDAAYQGAWNDLVARYDNQRILLFVHMRNVLSCPNVAKSSPSEIKRLLATVNQSIRAFTSLKRPVDQWDDWLVHLLVSKLDSHTRLHWETSLADSRAFPTFKQLQEFLENRIRALEAANPEASLARTTSTPSPKTTKGSRVSANMASTAKPKGKSKCLLCQDAHALPYCARFKAMTVVQRSEQAKKLGACLNCLRGGHHADACPSTGRCLVCAGKHHTALHGFQPQPVGVSGVVNMNGSPASTAKALNMSVSTYVSRPAGVTLLATAQIILQSDAGQSIKVKALLDPGSEATFVSERAAQQLRARRKRVHVTVAGLQGIQTGTVTSSIGVGVRSPVNPTVHIKTEALVLRNLTNLLPAKQVLLPSGMHLFGLTLADPLFNVPAKVDAILGADIYDRILEPDIRRGDPGTPTALRTAFGWVLTGTVQANEQGTVASHRLSVHHALSTDDISRALQRFWEIEEIPSQQPQDPDETKAEQHFRATHARDLTGRYVVRLPRKEDKAVRLGASRPAALSMLLSSERRLSKQPDLHKRYTDFMVEYLALGHMNPVGPEKSVARDSYYLPHHAVFKAGDPAGKIRVVFNASCRTTSGYSLNDCLLPGPRLQADLWLILSKWRLFRIGFMADIVKMFRQIQVHPEDANLQRILWRATPSEEVRDYYLTTVTYGATSAPFLALRTLRQLAQDESERFPLGAAILTRHSYVDDILAGGDS
nr:PREDICTED: uncharacterized protein LOC105667925 [Linepithema humile]